MMVHEVFSRPWEKGLDAMTEGARKTVLAWYN